MDKIIDWEAQYDFDFIIPQSFNEYKACNIINQGKELRPLKKEDLIFLIKSLPQDRNELVAKPDEVVSLFFGSDKQTFIQNEDSDFEYTYEILSSALKDLESNEFLDPSSEVFIRVLYFRKLTTLFSQGWYLSKRVNFSREILSDQLRRFGEILYNEEYISTSKTLYKVDIINRFDESSVSIESLIGNDYLHYDFYACEKKLLASILSEGNHTAHSIDNEFRLIRPLLSQAEEGKLLFCLFK
ncbi:hypothetical protein [Desertivirga arenae]|uniref:hypothetical protein n=1 Tax=Desertivirga arenae TaxID=2810309 RepID=UPI001A95D73E|nr:hypothetical protein [Pedobacter sp. SYSU D00823]